MNDINRLNITGRVTRDGELKYTQGGTPLLTFGVAVNERRKNPRSGEFEDYPNFIDCVVWNEFAQKVQPYILKGVAVTIEGHLRWSQWERDGQKRSKLECFVDHLITHRGQGETRQAQPQQQPTYSAPPQVPTEVYDEDIPF